MSRVVTVVLFAGFALIAACSEPLGPAEDALAADRRSADAVRAWRYEGCGDLFGTCAAVVLYAQPLGEGMWHLRGSVENLSWRAPDQLRRNSMLVFARLDEAGPGLWSGYSEFDCGGCNDDGSPGQRLSVIEATFRGPLDERCARNTRCAALSLEDFVIPGPDAFPFAHPGTVHFEYVPGPVTFELTVWPGDDWDPRRAMITVSQFFVGGKAFPDGSLASMGVTEGGFGGGLEEYELRFRRMEWLTPPDPQVAATGSSMRTPLAAGGSSFERDMRAARAFLGISSN